MALFPRNIWTMSERFYCHNQKKGDAWDDPYSACDDPHDMWDDPRAAWITSLMRAMFSDACDDPCDAVGNICDASDDLLRPFYNK